VAICWRQEKWLIKGPESGLLLIFLAGSFHVAALPQFHLATDTLAIFLLNYRQTPMELPLKKI
jgi:hypothetical protein